MDGPEVVAVRVESTVLSDHVADRAPAHPADLNACLNSHGLFNPMQFVLRLSPEVHRKIDALQPASASGRIDFEGLRAFSTYVHETIHWWQHIGSTTGLMLSLSYPGQSHANHTHLKKLLAQIGPKKSILRFVEAGSGPGGGPGTPEALASTVVNNHFDIEFFRTLCLHPDRAGMAVKHPYFECVGHSYEIAYGNMVHILAATLDDGFNVLPDPRGWEDAFASLRSRKLRGYYWGSDISIPPLGAYQIFEGQARFGQLQYLYFATGGKFTWDDVRSLGMLTGVYGEAFGHFLRLTELDWPSSIDDPVVALFLLVCDISMNPGAGFPMPLRVFDTFLEDVDPGHRFLFLCWTIAKHRPDLAQAIRKYSRAEYAEVTEALTGPLLVDSPLAIAATVASWANRNERLKGLMSEYERFDYGPVNLPVHLMFSHFMAFCRDKLAGPEFFCWPGAWMAGDRLSPEVENLFHRHEALFMDKPDDGGIYPRLMPGKDETVVQEVFERFYAVNVAYDLTRQWIATSGPFEYDYRWLSSTGTGADMKGFGDRHFEQIYGVHPDRFLLI